MQSLTTLFSHWPQVTQSRLTDVSLESSKLHIWKVHPCFIVMAKSLKECQQGDDFMLMTLRVLLTC